MKSIRFKAQRALQAPTWSARTSFVEICGTLPADVASQPRKPGTFSSIMPPVHVAGGPQQGGLSFFLGTSVQPHAGSRGLQQSILLMVLKSMLPHKNQFLAIYDNKLKDYQYYLLEASSVAAVIA
jgi:hypothetical protein